MDEYDWLEKTVRLILQRSNGLISKRAKPGSAVRPGAVKVRGPGFEGNYTFSLCR
jgi:hypothetical protein